MLTIPEKLIKLIIDAMNSNVTGSIEIHLYQGKISVIKRIETTKI
jgi:argininosuccinate synthase